MKRKDLARKAKSDDKTEAEANPSFKSFTFDLQAVLYASCSNVSSFFYTRKFCTYNFTIKSQRVVIATSGMRPMVDDDPMKLEAF